MIFPSLCHSRRFSDFSGRWRGFCPVVLSLSVLVKSEVSVGVNAIELGRVLKDDLVGNLIRNFRKVFLDDLTGVGPGGISVGKVRSPHVVVLTKELVVRRPHGIILEGCP